MRTKPRVEPRRERLEMLGGNSGKSQLAGPAPKVTKSAPGQIECHGTGAFGTAQKITEQIRKVISSAAPSSRILSRPSMPESPEGSLSVLERSVLSSVGTKIEAAMNRRTTSSIAKEKRFGSSQPRQGTW